MNNQVKRRQEFCLRLANHIGVSRNAEKFSDLPKNFQAFVSTLRDCDILAPLIAEDRIVRGMTFGEIGIKYGINKNVAYANFNSYRPMRLDGTETEPTHKE